MHGSNWGKYIKDVTKYDLNMQADTVKTAIKKLTDTLEKTHASFVTIICQNNNALIFVSLYNFTN